MRKKNNAYHFSNGSAFERLAMQHLQTTGVYHHDGSGRNPSGCGVDTDEEERVP
jgi:hypothetical protein